MKTRTFPRLRVVVALSLASNALLFACGWDPSRPFDRESPEVNQAIGHLDGGDATTAGDLLQTYLQTGACKEGSIGTPPRVRAMANGSFDLGLAIFKIAERYGRRFGEEEVDAGPADEALKGQRTEQVDCALRIVTAIAEDRAVPVDLRARAYYLQGNLHFLNANYEEAVRAYDKALELAPGMGDAGPLGASDAGPPITPDLVGRDSAWNRAIALRRIEDKKDAGNDASNDASQDSGGDSGQNDENKDSGKDDKDSGKDSGGDSGQNDEKDSGKDSGDDQNKPPPPKPDEQDAGAPPPPSKQNQDERMLDQLENAPTVQQEAARKQGQKRRVRGMSDK
ncbi:hypothetical protein AKJ09_10540 [Labilithrix luteola]|uniref:Uncharacterized protein n=1 Tax=Labilithrix luteola TaxID=1391654 RepID=A0A0K1QDZ2_9BACT|nr:tetratricopeptide repeat protein [Labilithrix luteola]AKV03877.1 hypothetical protein AKJ09_10540 [Labilithrix luteola]